MQDDGAPGPAPELSNADIADRLASLAQLLQAQRENPYKVKAYRRAAATVRTLSDSIPFNQPASSGFLEFAGNKYGAAQAALAAIR